MVCTMLTFFTVDATVNFLTMFNFFVVDSIQAVNIECRLLPLLSSYRFYKCYLLLRKAQFTISTERLKSLPTTQALMYLLLDTPSLCACYCSGGT